MTSIVWIHAMEVNGYRQQSGHQHSSEYLFLCVIEGINSYRFGTTWGVKDDSFNFQVNYAFIISQFDFVSHSLMLSHILT